MIFSFGVQHSWAANLGSTYIHPSKWQPWHVIVGSRTSEPRSQKQNSFSTDGIMFIKRWDGMLRPKGVPLASILRSSKMAMENPIFLLIRPLQHLKSRISAGDLQVPCLDARGHAFNRIILVATPSLLHPSRAAPPAKEWWPSKWPTGNFPHGDFFDSTWCETEHPKMGVS